MHFFAIAIFFNFGALRGSFFVRSGKSSFWSPREPLKKRNFGIVEKCCCGNCRSNLFRRFQNFAFLRPSWGPPFKGLFSSCIFYNFKISRFWGSLLGPSWELPASRLFAPLKNRNFGIVEKCCCGNCRSNLFRRFRNFAFLRPS